MEKDRTYLRATPRLISHNPRFSEYSEEDFKEAHEYCIAMQGGAHTLYSPSESVELTRTQLENMAIVLRFPLTHKVKILEGRKR